MRAILQGDIVEDDFEQDVKIDHNRLDFEWQRQAELTAKWARKLAVAKEKRMRAEQKHKVLKADIKWQIEQERAKIDFDIRRYPEDYGLSKSPTEFSINHAINRDKEFLKFVLEKEEEVKQAFSDYVDCVRDEEIYAAAVKAMVDKKKALENLEQLYVTEYYGEPKSMGFSRDARFQRSKEIGKELREISGANRRGK